MDGIRVAKIVGGAALLWYGVLRGAQGLICKVQDYAFRGIDFDSGTVSIDLRFIVKNPLFVGLTLKGIQGDVYIQGQKAGYINTKLDYYLSGGHTHIIPVIVNLSISGLGSALVANIQSGDIRTLTIDFDGKLFVGNMNVGVPVQISKTYDDLTKD